jgi:hypothetical protein
MTNKRLGDILKVGSSADVLLAIQEAAARLAALATHIQSTYPRTERTLALRNLATRIGQELLRIAKNLDESHDLLAWATRNIFELNLLVRYVLLAEGNAKLFMAEAAKDEVEVLEGFASLSGIEDKEAQGIVALRITHIKTVTATHGIVLKRSLSPADLAKLVGCAAEHKGLFKFLSKYVHPSSWLVNMPSSETQSDTYWNLLVVHSQLYAADAYERIRSDCGIPIAA